MKNISYKRVIKYLFIFLLASLFPIVNTYIFYNDVADLSEIFYVFAMFFYAMIIIPILSILTLFLPKNSFFNFDDIVLTLCLSFSVSFVLVFLSVFKNTFFRRCSFLFRSFSPYVISNCPYLFYSRKP